MIITCPECHVGRLHHIRATYLQPLPDQFLVFPHAPALRCDMCARIEFDTLFTDMMEALVAGQFDQEPADLLMKTLFSTGHGPHRFKMM